MSVKQKCNRVEVATGRVKADTVIKNAKIVNVFTKEIIVWYKRWQKSVRRLQ